MPLAFAQRFLAGGREPLMVLCHSINAESIVGRLQDGGDTQTLSHEKNNFLQWQGCKEFLQECLHPTVAKSNY